MKIPSIVLHEEGVTLSGSRSFAEKAASRLLRSHRVREGSVGEGVSPALDASATKARANLTVKAELKRALIVPKPLADQPKPLANSVRKCSGNETLPEQINGLYLLPSTSTGLG
jgi:hypothetical protein